MVLIKSAIFLKFYMTHPFIKPVNLPLMNYLAREQMTKLIFIITSSE